MEFDADFEFAPAGFGDLEGFARVRFDGFRMPMWISYYTTIRVQTSGVNVLRM